MPVHDGAAWIGETLTSLVSEPLSDVEILIFDSSPTDDTAGVIADFEHCLPIKLFRCPEIGPWQTKTNLGVRKASADHVCILHQDDIWLPGRMAAARKWIASAPAVALHLAPTDIIDHRGRYLGRWQCPLPADREISADFLLERLLVQNFISVPSPVFRRAAWMACGGMDEQLWYTPDWDIWAKLAEQGPIMYHKERTTGFRVHGGSLTVTGSRDVGEFRSQMESVLDRHLPRLSQVARRKVEPSARASIAVNAALAAASGGVSRDLPSALRQLLALGPVGLQRYLRDSRLRERVMPRLRAKLIGAL
jgi:hypothetical protein